MTNKTDLNQPNYGISLREHFAGLMMQAQFIHHGAKGDYSWNENEAAKEAVSCADTLIAELSKELEDFVSDYAIQTCNCGYPKICSTCKDIAYAKEVLKGGDV